MRNHLVRLFTAAIIMCISAGVLAQDSGGSRPFYFGASLGLMSPALGDVNDYLTSNEAIFESSLGRSVSWDEFGRATMLGGEIGKQISATAYFGAKITYQKSSLDNGYSNNLGSVAYDSEYQLIDISGRVKFELPSTPGLYLGISGGFASGKFTEYLAGRFIADPSNNITVTSEYTGSGLSLGGFAGYKHSVGTKVALVGELGYKYRNLGSFEGNASSPELGSYAGPATDNSGKEMDFDFSGISAEIGVVFNLGG